MVAKGCWLIEREEHRTITAIPGTTVGCEGCWLIEREEHRTMTVIPGTTVADRPTFRAAREMANPALPRGRGSVTEFMISVVVIGCVAKGPGERGRVHG